ncbi:DNA recombination protein RmuC, partial [Candidatus Marinamargulisbacteria bacterium SCGC AG-439-L15]
VLVFIPNEQIYGFINEENRSLLDDALAQKVIFCSPMTLYALLAVIRQALDNFTFEKKAHEMLKHLGEFNKQWQKFKDSMEKMGKRIEDAQREYTTLMTTRKNQLDKPLLKIDEMKESVQPELEAPLEKLV